MKLLWNRKDGGPESRVFMYGIESKRLGSALVLRFEDGSRDAYHSHAFNALSWVLSGLLHKERIEPLPEPAGDIREEFLHGRSRRPIVTLRSHLHKVVSVGRSWVLSFRGPWAQTWNEVLPGGRFVTLKQGRVQV